MIEPIGNNDNGNNNSKYTWAFNSDLTYSPGGMADTDIFINGYRYLHASFTEPPYQSPQQLRRIFTNSSSSSMPTDKPKM